VGVFGVEPLVVAAGKLARGATYKTQIHLLNLGERGKALEWDAAS
jgi:hypothetical protein